MNQSSPQDQNPGTRTAGFENARDAAAASTWAKSLRPAGQMMQMNLRDLEAACAAAGLDLTKFEHNILRWFASFEPASTMVFASLIARANGGTP